MFSREQLPIIQLHTSTYVDNPMIHVCVLIHMYKLYMHVHNHINFVPT